MIPAENSYRLARSVCHFFCHPLTPPQTLCEQVILRALNRTSIPEYTPTRPRLSYYPRTAFFKRERVAAELERLIAHAEANGGSAADVDSVYLRGPEAVAEHERRNGYDKAFGPNGVLSAYGPDGRQAFNNDEGRHTVQWTSRRVAGVRS